VRSAKLEVFRQEPEELHNYIVARVPPSVTIVNLELAAPMTVEDIWPDKIEYQFCIPQKAIVFGTTITINIRFTSLLKGLRIGMIRCVLFEYQEFTLLGEHYQCFKKIAS
jgi:hypothetical protein